MDIKRMRYGFSLIEVVVALAILVIIIASTLGLLASTYANIRDSEMRDIAKNIASYTMEYIRSRNVTADNTLGFDSTLFGSDNTHPLPGLVDLWNIPLQAIGHTTGSLSNSATNCINDNPALPGDTFSNTPLAFYYSLQGYVSLGDFDYLTPTRPNPSPEDANAYICNYTIRHYHNFNMQSYNGGVSTDNHLMMRFPFNSTINNGTAPNPEAIKSFTAFSNYLPMVYTDDPNKTDPTKPDYNPFYTNDITLKPRTQAYRGFRILISIAARRESAASPDHVQYFDVKVVVLWKFGRQERSYTLASQIVTYGG